MGFLEFFDRRRQAKKMSEKKNTLNTIASIFCVIMVWVFIIKGVVSYFGEQNYKRVMDKRVFQVEDSVKDIQFVTTELLLYQTIEDYIIKKGSKYMSHGECTACARIIYRYHQKYGTEGIIPIGLDYDLILALIDTESSFNPEAKSYAGAIGLTQQMPFTARDGFARYLDQPNLPMEKVIEYAKISTTSLILGLERLIEYQLGFMAAGHASSSDWKLSLSLYNWSTQAVSNLIQADYKSTPKASLKYAINIEKKRREYEKILGGRDDN